MMQHGLLVALRLESLAIVDRAELVLGPGLTVMTGETGAGKSILVDALALILGGKGGADLVRAGAEEAVVEGLFELGPTARERFEAAGIPLTDGQAVVRRVVARSGRGRATVNGHMVTRAMLADLLRGLVDVSGQHEHVSLLDADTHLDLLDAFGGHGNLVTELGQAFLERERVRSEIERLNKAQEQRHEREDLLRFQLEELRAVDPKPNELDALEAERKKLAHVGKIAEVVRRAEAMLYSDDGAVVEIVGRVESELMEVAKLDPGLAPLCASAAASASELGDLAQGLLRYGRALEADPERLLAVEDRLHALRKLMKRHGGSLELVLAARERNEAELAELEESGERKAELDEVLERRSARVLELERKVTQARNKAARALEAAAKAELSSLSMGGTDLKVDLVPLASSSPRGAERAEIMIAPNPGEPLMPLARTASGGELSRILLALKHVISADDRVGTYVFDEVDSGIGGTVATVIGRKLRDLGRSRQVLCITHLPQVAAFADDHWAVTKHIVDGRTLSRITHLEPSGVTEELARMLGGANVSDKSRALARELRSEAQVEPSVKPIPIRPRTSGRGGARARSA
ncbi:MAG: DNA repair protein RecN [Myxococcota bacterium]